MSHGWYHIVISLFESNPLAIGQWSVYSDELCMLYTSHGEYPAFSVGENFSPDTDGHVALIPMLTAASPGGSQSEPLFTRAF
jgi:hypothetical protein